MIQFNRPYGFYTTGATATLSTDTEAALVTQGIAFRLTSQPLANTPYAAVENPAPGSTGTQDLAALTANLANATDTTKGDALLGHRGQTVQTKFDQLAARRVKPTLLRNRQPMRNLLRLRSVNSNAATITQTLTTPDQSTLKQLAASRRRITSLTCSGNTATAICQNAHGLATGDRVRLFGANSTFYNSDTNVANLAAKNIVVGRLFFSWPVTYVDDFTFTYTTGGGPTSPDTSTNIWWEISPTWWPASDTVFNFPVPGSRDVLTLGANLNTSFPPYNIGTFFPSQAKVQTITFICEEDTFEFYAARNYWRILVDGIPQSPTLLNFETPSNYPGFLTRLAFPTAKPRIIEIEGMVTTAFFGVITRGRSGIRAVDRRAARQPLAMFCGDSFGEGAGTQGTIFSEWALGWPYLMGKRLGMDMIHGSLGSTGLTTNGGRGAGMEYPGRMIALKAGGIEPDVVFVSDSINDGANVTVANSTAFIQLLRVLWPAAEIIVLGRLWINETLPAGAITSTQNWLTTCLNLGIPYVDGGIGALGKASWINAQNKTTYYIGNAATGTTAVSGGAVTSVTVANPGSGFDPIAIDSLGQVVTFSGGGGTGAVATASYEFHVTDIQVINGGTGYTTATLTIGHGGAAAAILSGATVNSIYVTAVGSFTKVPTVTLTGGGGTGATAVALIEDGRLVGFTVTNAGTGYTSAPTVNIATSTTPCIATATIVGGVITGVTITDPGSLFTDTPICTVTGDGGGAELVPFISGTVTAINVTNGGSGYGTAPTVTVSAPADATHPKNNGHRMLALRYANEIENG